MTRYGVTYYSESKKTDIALEDMATPHLINAWRKTGGAAPATNENRELIEAIEAELGRRGCTRESGGDRWTLPVKEGAA